MTHRSIVFLNRFYWPDIAATAQMLTDLAEDLAARGWTVTVIASSTPYEGQNVSMLSHEWRNGVEIYRTKGTRFGRHTLPGRLADYASYVAAAFLRLLRLPAPDLIVGLSDPPFIALVAVLAARLRRRRSVYWVQDLFPQIAGELGVMRPRSLAYRLAARLARWLNGHADLVVALGPRMAERMVAEGARPDRVAFVHNWADATAIHPVAPDDNPFIREHGLTGKFVVLYSGNAGRAHRFDGVMQAARLLRDDPDVVFLFIGGGKRTPELQREALAEGLGNVRFLGYLPREALAWSLSAADLSLVTEDPAMAGLLVPSKSYGILASGRPMVFMGAESSDVAALVRETGSGFVLAPDDGEGLRATIDRLRADPALRRRLGERAREQMVASFDRTIATAHWARTVEERLWAPAR